MAILYLFLGRALGLYFGLFGPFLGRALGLNFDLFVPFLGRALGLNFDLCGPFWARLWTSILAFFGLFWGKASGLNFCLFGLKVLKARILRKIAKYDEICQNFVEIWKKWQICLEITLKILPQSAKLAKNGQICRFAPKSAKFAKFHFCGIFLEGLNQKIQSAFLRILRFLKFLRHAWIWRHGGLKG